MALCLNHAKFIFLPKSAPEVKIFPGGACPQTPLEAKYIRARTYTLVHIQSP